MSILLCHITFRKAQAVQGVDPAYIAYRAPFGVVGSYIALGFLTVLIITKGAEVFVGEFDYQTFILGYIGIPVYLALYLGYKLVTRSSIVKSADVDLVTGVPELTVAEERAQYKARQREREEASPHAYWARKLYALFSWLF
jgi:amino acid transporter